MSTEEIEDFGFNDFYQEYGLSKIIYVNSSEYGYGELDLSRNLVIYGFNNAGKTSSLSGTKIALFPEVSFTRCATKFRFTDKHGVPYDTTDSYRHYFPSSRSFVILEAQNPQGVFTMVCYRTNNFKYARFFIPAAYDDVKDVFVDVDTGELNSELSVALVQERCKTLNGIRVTEKSELVELMVGSRLAASEKSRYCLIPLNDAKQSTIEAFKNTYQLAFDSGQTAKTTLPNILATHIEMKRGREKEKLDANLPALIQAREILVQKSNNIQAYENSRRYFDVAWTELNELNQAIANYGQLYHTISEANIVAKREYAPTLERLSSQQKELFDAKEESKKALDKAIKDRDEKRWEYKKALKDEAKKDKAYKQARATRERYSFNTNDTELLNDLDERLREARENLKIYTTEGGISENVQKLIIEQNGTINEREKIKGKIADQKNLIFTHLGNEHAIDVLNTLNTHIGGATYNLRPEDKAIFIAFTEIFGFDVRGRLTINGDVVNESLTKQVYDAGEQLSEWKDKLSVMNDQIDSRQQKIEELQTALKTDDIAGVIEDSEKEVNKLSDTIEDIRFLPKYENDLKEALEHKEKVAEEGNELSALCEEGGKLSVKAETDYAAWAEVSGKVDELREQLNSAEELDNTLKTAAMVYEPPYIKTIEDFGVPTLEHKDNLNRLLNAFQTQKSKLVDSYHALASRVDHESIDKHAQIGDVRGYDRNIRLYRDTFETLEHERIKLNDEISGHNGVLNSQLNELREARNTVTREVAEINAELNKQKISNLSDVRLAVEFEPTFTSIMGTLDKHEISKDSLLEESFYTTLSKLVENKFYNKSNGRLNLIDIIKSVSYEYHKEATGEFETKGQSGGTTTTVQTFLLAVLLKRISAKYTRLMLPIIVDEIGTIDHRNSRATIGQIRDQGFSIFCATPTYSASINKMVGRYVIISQHNLKTPMVRSCNMKCLLEYIEEFGEVAA